MIISHVHIENYKSIRSLDLQVGRLQTLVGENNSGKSNTLEAIAVFLSGSVAGVNEKAFNSLSLDIVITITFDHLTQAEEEDFRKYLGEQQVTFTEIIHWDQEEGKPTCKYHGLIREPVNDYLKQSKLEQWTNEDLERFVNQYDLPSYFRSERSGNVGKTSYREGLTRYLRENPDIPLEPAEAATTQALGYKEVLKGKLPRVFLLPAVRDYKDESKLTSTTSFGRLIGEITTRIARQEPQALERVDRMIALTERFLNPPRSGEADERPDALRNLEISLTEILRETMPSVRSVLVEVPLPRVQDILQSEVKMTIDDGLPTAVSAKGHGLQRAVIFALLRAYVELLKAQTPEDEEDRGEEPQEKAFILAIESPELYLHPQAQRSFFAVLKDLSKQHQVLFSTHSTQFVDLEDYQSIAIVRKPNLDIGTTVREVREDIFSDLTEKEEFRMTKECDPNRSELFFARRVILVEGPADKIAIEQVARCLGVREQFDQRVLALIECGGKPCIPLYMKLLNGFRIAYTVVYDVDPERPEEEARNRRIEELLDPETGSNLMPLNPRLEGLAGLGPETHLTPYEAYKHFSNPDNLTANVNTLVLSLLDASAQSSAAG